MGNVYVFICHYPHPGGLPRWLSGSLPAMQETRVQFLGQEDALEKEMATHSGILAWEIPWTDAHGIPKSMGL